MTLEQFRATRVSTDHLGSMLPEEYFVDADGKPAKVPGFVYADSLYIQTFDDGTYYLVMGNDERVHRDLSELEKELYAYAISEMVITAPNAASSLAAR